MPNYTNLIVLFKHILTINLNQFHKWWNKILIMLKQYEILNNLIMRLWTHRKILIGMSRTIQWQCSVISTTKDFFHPNSKYPIIAPKTTDRHSHELYVMNISISISDRVTWIKCRNDCRRWLSENIVGLKLIKKKIFNESALINYCFVKGMQE